MSNDFESIAVKPDSLSCIKLPANVVCNSCAVKELVISEFNRCLHHLQNGELPNVCEMDKISTIQDKSLQISETEWAYADGTPGTITKKCKDKTYEKVALQTDGILHINPDCQ